MIEAEHLTKRYGEKTAVDDLSFTVRPPTSATAQAPWIPMPRKHRCHPSSTFSIFQENTP